MTSANQTSVSRAPRNKSRRRNFIRDCGVLHSRGEDFGWKVGDVGGDGPARQELSHLVGEGVAVVLEQTIPVTSEPGKNGGELMHQITAFMHRDQAVRSIKS